MAGKNKTLMVSSIVVAMLLISLNSAFAFDKLFIVANQEALNLAKDFLTTLNNESIPLAIIMDQFEKVKNEKYIIVLGGAKGPGSVDDFVKQVLTAQEQESGNHEGKMFVKENVFTQGQTIIVFTGPDDASAAVARKSSRKNWWPYLAKWFEIDTSSPMPY